MQLRIAAASKLDRIQGYAHRVNCTNADRATAALVLPWAYDLWTLRESPEAFRALAFALRSWVLYFPFVEGPTAAKTPSEPSLLASIKDPRVEAALLWVAHTLGVKATSLVYVALRVDTLARTEYGEEEANYLLALASMRPDAVGVETTWQNLNPKATKEAPGRASAASASRRQPEKPSSAVPESGGTTK